MDLAEWVARILHESNGDERDREDLEGIVELTNDENVFLELVKLRPKGVGVLEQLADPLEAVEDLDQPRVVVVEAAGDRTFVLQHPELGQRDIGERRTAGVGVVQACERSDPVDAAAVAHGLVVWELHVAEVLDRLADRVERFDVGERVWRCNNALHGLERLQVTVTPAS